MSFTSHAAPRLRRFLSVHVGALLLVIALLASSAANAAEPSVSLTISQITSTSVSLSWTSAGMPEVYSYELGTYALGTSSWQDIGNATSRTVTGLCEGRKYGFRVKAHTSAGDVLSNCVIVQPGLNSPPASPGNLTATAVSAGQIDLKWQDNSSNERLFKIERALSSRGPFTLIATLRANVTSYSDRALAEFTAYYYRLSASNAAGDSPCTNRAEATTFSSAPPPAPSDLTAAAVSTSQIDLAWQDNSLTETAISVERATSPAGPYVEIGAVGPDVTTYSDANLPQAATHFYRVRGCNQAGWSAYAGPASATTAAPQAVFDPTLVGFISDVGTVNDVVVAGTTAYIASDPFGVVVVDVFDPADPAVLGSQHPLGPATHLAVSANGGIAVACGTPRGTDIVDLSDPLYPEVLASIAGSSGDAAIIGNLAYVVTGGDVKVMDISTPSNPQLVTTLVTPGIASGIAVSGQIAVVSDAFSGMRVVDISNPYSPAIIGSVTLGGVAGKAAITGSLALVANGSLSSVQVVDISVPTNPRLVGSLNTGSALDVTASGNKAYVSANGSGLKIVELSNPAAPSLVSTYACTASACAVSGGIAYVAQGSGGLRVVNVSVPSAPSLMRNLASGSVGSASHLAASGSLAVACGTPRGTDIVDISDPYCPSILSSITGSSGDAAIVGNLAYIVTGGDVKVMNISTPSSPQLVSTLVTPGIASGIAVSGQIAVVSDAFSGLRVVDISNPASPAIVGSVALGGVAGKAAITGNLALVANGSLSSVQVVDISVPSNPRLIGSLNTGSALDVTASGNKAYVSANGSGLKIVDLSNPAAPALVSTYACTASACAVSGGIAYVAQGSAGLTMVDVSNPAALKLVETIKTTGNCNDVVVLSDRAVTADSAALVDMFLLWR